MQALMNPKNKVTKATWMLCFLYQNPHDAVLILEGVNTEGHRVIEGIYLDKTATVKPLSFNELKEVKAIAKGKKILTMDLTFEQVKSFRILVNQLRRTKMTYLEKEEKSSKFISTEFKSVSELFTGKAYHAYSWALMVWQSLKLNFNEKLFITCVVNEHPDKPIIPNNPSEIDDPIDKLHEAALIFFHKGDINSALNTCNEAIKLNPKQANTWCLKGLIQTHIDINQALLCFEEAIRLEKDPFSLQGKALILLHQNQLNGFALLHEADALLKNYPNPAEVWYQRGRLAQALHRPNYARQCFQKVKELNPKHSDAIEQLERLDKPKAEWQTDALSNSNAHYLEATPSDLKKVIRYYQHHPVSGKSVAQVQVINAPNLEAKFKNELSTLQARHNNSAFEPKWKQDPNPDTRQKVDTLAQELTSFYPDKQYPNVKFLPLWHGTHPNIIESIFKTGYVSLAVTDSGYYGRGIYGAYEAEYAEEVYSKGALLINWVAFYSAYPTIDGDKAKLETKGAYGNYDAHFVPVVKPQFLPPKPNESYSHIEVVVFQSSQVLPRYLVKLQSDFNPHLFFKTHILQPESIDLSLAAKWLMMHPKGTHYQYADIQIPENGLAHQLRLSFYAPYVIQSYLEKHPLDKVLYSKLKLIQLALLLGDQLEDYLQEKNIKLDLSYLETQPAQLILMLCRDLDQIRCLEAKAFDTLSKERLSLLGKPAVESLIQLAECCLIATGESIQGSLRQPRQGAQFIQANQDLTQCDEALQSALDQWTCQTMTRTKL